MLVHCIAVCAGKSYPLMLFRLAQVLRGYQVGGG